MIIITGIALFIHRWKRARNFYTYRGILVAFLTNPRNFKTKLFKIIWDGLKKMDKFPDAADIILKEYIFLLLLDIMEETMDPHGSER
jgi:hypothetical protein